jgi:hypothetical protein
MWYLLLCGRVLVCVMRSEVGRRDETRWRGVTWFRGHLEALRSLLFNSAWYTFETELCIIQVMRKRRIREADGAMHIDL